MVGCPFGFHASPDDECDVEETDNDAKKSVPQAKSSGCPFGASVSSFDFWNIQPCKPLNALICTNMSVFVQKRDGDDRFDYNKDPVAWFYQVGHSCCLVACSGLGYCLQLWCKHTHTTCRKTERVKAYNVQTSRWHVGCCPHSDATTGSTTAPSSPPYWRCGHRVQPG